MWRLYGTVYRAWAGGDITAVSLPAFAQGLFTVPLHQEQLYSHVSFKA